jgi:hypothetical protein
MIDQWRGETKHTKKRGSEPTHKGKMGTGNVSYNKLLEYIDWFVSACLCVFCLFVVCLPFFLYVV